MEKQNIPWRCRSYGDSMEFIRGANMNDNGMINLIEMIFKQISIDYKLLWYIKTHYEDGGEWEIKSDRHKRSKKRRVSAIYIMGIKSTVNEEIEAIEDYVNSVMPNYATDIINYLRTESDSKDLKDQVERIRIA